MWDELLHCMQNSVCKSPILHKMHSDVHLHCYFLSQSAGLVLFHCTSALWANFWNIFCSGLHNIHIISNMYCINMHNLQNKMNIYSMIEKYCRFLCSTDALYLSCRQISRNFVAQVCIQYRYTYCCSAFKLDHKQNAVNIFWCPARIVGSNAVVPILVRITHSSHRSQCLHHIHVSRSV